MKTMTELDEIELFKLDVQIPPRSRLFSLPATGIGSTMQESLISLLVRTSRAHAVNPRNMIRNIFAEVEPAISKLAYGTFFSHLAGTINGLGQYAELFTTATEKLTRHRDLSCLTMLPWKDLFPHNGQGLLAKHPKWCPDCLIQQWQQGMETVFPLAWYMETFRICPAHLRPLEHLCPYCRKSQPFIPRYPELGICDHCRRPLPNETSLVQGNRRISPDRFELWVAEAIGDMVMYQPEDEFAPTADIFRNFVREQVQSLAQGNRAAFCRAIGFHSHALNGWLNKGERPAFTQFLALCYGMNIMPTDIFRRSTPPTDGTLQLPPAKLKNRRSNPKLTQQRRNELEVLLKNHLHPEERLSVTAIAKLLGLNPSVLRYWFPDLCTTLSMQHKISVKTRSKTRIAQQCRRTEAVVKMLLWGKRYPSRRQVNYVLKEERMSLAQPHVLEAYQNTLNKVHIG